MLASAQSFPGQVDFSWPDVFVNYKSVPDSLKNEDAVILGEQVVITERYLKHRVAIKILSSAGSDAFKTIRLPENFDITNFPHQNKFGRFKDRKDPFIYSFKIEYFAARIIKPNKRIIELPLKYNTERVYWVGYTGQRVYDLLYQFEMMQLEPGDILEYMYKANVDWNNCQSVIYPNGLYPKFNYNLIVQTSTPNFYKEIDQVYNTNVPANYFKVEPEYTTSYILKNYTYHFDFLKACNYPHHSIPGLNLPNVSINHGLFWAPSTTNSSSAMQNYVPRDVYKWTLLVDTMKTALFDKYHGNLRKFLSKFPEDKSDSTGNQFAAKLTDTLNGYRFISAENLKHGEYAQYSLSSSEHLLKGRLTQEFGLKNYGDILAERGIFYYYGILIDKRHSSVNPDYRNHAYLEQGIIVIPEKKSFKYYIPRFAGIKYFPDEVPFYFEATKCALRPCVNCPGNEKNQSLLFISTPKSNSNQNARVENVSVKVLGDSLKMRLSIKENLSGQFSTILRHFYNKDLVDSTIDAHYYKKCTDKPFSKQVSLRQTSSSKLFPFKHTYSCSEEIGLVTKAELSLKDWFSFLWTKDQFKKAPTHDYYVDFTYTNAYNYLFEFDKATEVINGDSFNKKFSNNYFDLASSLAKQEDGKYLLSVVVSVKQNMIPERDGTKIVEFAEMLDEINNFKLQLKN